MARTWDHERRARCILRGGTRSSAVRPPRVQFVPPVSLLLFFSLTCWTRPAQATIYTYNMSAPADHVELSFEEAFPSLPGLFGGAMNDSHFYRARLQFLRDDAYLCETETEVNARLRGVKGKNSFVRPRTHDAPVALLAGRGYCPFYNKALIAESYGDAVQYLIVYNNDIDGEDVLVPMYSEYGKTRLILLSVTHRTGQALKRYIAGQSQDVLDDGGPLIGFNNLPPEGVLTVEDLQNYVLSALGLFFMFVSFSGCVLIWVGRRQMAAAAAGGGGTRIIFVDGPAVATQAAGRNRLLTNAQIQQLVVDAQRRCQRQQQGSERDEEEEEFFDNEEVVGPASLTTVVAHEEDCCAVCMEDFEPEAEHSDAHLSLPCGHLFHKECTCFFFAGRVLFVLLLFFFFFSHLDLSFSFLNKFQQFAGVVPWLTERQSKCPLCKFDVAEYLRQLPAERGGSIGSNGSIVSAWNPLRWLRYRSWTAVSPADEHHTVTDADSHEGEGGERRPAVALELAEPSSITST